MLHTHTQSLKVIVSRNRDSNLMLFVNITYLFRSWHQYIHFGKYMYKCWFHPYMSHHFDKGWVDTHWYLLNKSQSSTSSWIAFTHIAFDFFPNILSFNYRLQYNLLTCFTCDCWFICTRTTMYTGQWALISIWLS